jgi:hypothetical protein
MRKLDALNKLYNRDLKEDLYDAQHNVTVLHDYLKACHKDGILTVKAVLKELAGFRNWLDNHLKLDLPADAPMTAEDREAIRAAGSL